MSQTINLKVAGIYSAPNPFSGAPDGGMLVANDVVIDQTNVLGPRRGFSQLAGTFPLTSDRANRFDYYGGITDSTKYLLAQWGSGKFGYYSAGSWTAYSGTFNPPDQAMARTRFLQQNQNFYFTTSTGVFKLDSVENDTPKLAGVPGGLDLQLALTGSSGFFSTQAAGTFTGTVTNGSLNITGFTTIPGNISVNQFLSDTNSYIPSGTTIASITPSIQTVVTTGTTAVGSTTVSSLANTTMLAGQLVTGAGILAGTTVVSVNIGGTSLVLSQAAIQAPISPATSVILSFASAPIITMSATATNTSTETITYSNGSQVAYRLVWGYKDANNNLLLGAPTQWTAITNNTGSTTNVQVTSSIPQGITTAYFYQVYRTFQTASASVTPSDEMQLCYEANPNNTDLSNGYVQFTDILIDALLGTSLYTSPSQQGIGQAYAQPPWCKDFCTFYNYAFYANTKSYQVLNLTIVGVGSPNGIQSTDTLLISGITYTAGAAENIGTNTFKVFTSGTPSQNITNTANSLVKVINRSSTSVVYANNVSGPNQLPGMLVITARTFGVSAFAVTASAHGGAYSPVLPTSGTTVSSAQNAYKNGIYCSVQGLTEAVPLENLLPLVGSASANILRVIALRDYVVILKEDGVFRLVGNNLSNFQILPFDYTTILVAPDSAVSLNNQVWCLANQGVVSISDTGVQQQSWTNINNIIQGLFGVAYSEVQQYSSGISYETDHKYILGLPSAGGDTGNTQTYTYNIFTSAWTRWTREFTTGFVHPTENRLYLSNFLNDLVVTENKTGTYLDFVDEATIFPVIVSHSDYVVILDSIAGINEGDLLYQNANDASVIVSIDSSAVTVTVEDLVDWIPGQATIFPAIHSLAQWKPIVAGNPGFLRQYAEGDLLFNTTRFNAASMLFSTELSQSFVTVPLTGQPLGNWGLFPWGSGAWGGGNNPVPIRFFVPQDTQLGSQLNVQFSIAQAWSNWALSGINIVYSDISEELDG